MLNQLKSMVTRSAHLKSASWFTIIGIIASAVHYFVAIGLAYLGSLSAIYANIFGFLIALLVSYVGHQFFSFPKKNKQIKKTFIRFFCVTLVGFLVNQCLIVFILKDTSLPFWLVLGVVMLTIAISTYLLSRFWVFKYE